MAERELTLSKQLIDLLLIDVRQLDLAQMDVRNQSYIRSYIEFLRYFEGLSTITEANVVIAANFTFAWMPTIARIDLSLLASATCILNRARACEPLHDSDLRSMKALLYSMVAASKLLHFTNPQEYPIWDGNVRDYLSRAGIGLPCDTNKLKSYLTYVELCQTLANFPQSEQIQTLVSGKLGYPVTRFRAIEFVMFSIPANADCMPNTLIQTRGPHRGVST
jgi:hypothetical protein